MVAVIMKPESVYLKHEGSSYWSILRKKVDVVDFDPRVIFGHVFIYISTCTYKRIFNT